MIMRMRSSECLMLEAYGYRTNSHSQLINEDHWSIILLFL